MNTLQELCGHLNTHFEIEKYKDSCPNGLQVEGGQKIVKAATAVTASLNVIKQAVAAGVDVLIVHHGLFWNRDEYPVVGVKREKLALLIENGISLLAYHLPMDAHRELGNNWKAAIDLGWSDLEPFGEYEGSYIGVKGRFPKMSLDTFQGRIEEYYAHKAHAAAGGAVEVQSAALISGGAYRAVSQAAKEGMDCFITGNFDLPAWDEAFERGVNFFAMGHSASERVGPIALQKYMLETLGLDTVFLDESNPF